MSFPLLKSTCPFCTKPFKTSGQLSNHLEREHPGRRLSTKRKFDETHESEFDTHASITVELDTNFYDFTLELAAIRSAFPNANFVPPKTTQQDNDSEYRELMPYTSSPATTADTNSDCGSSSNHTEFFPVDRQAGHILVNTPFHYDRHPGYKFFRPCAHVLDYKLARFFHAAHVPKARIDEFFDAGFIGKKTGSEYQKTLGSQNPMPPFSFKSSYTFYKKLDEMLTSPAWENGFVDFRLDKDTEFWYRDVLDCIQYLVRQKCYAKDIVWSPVRDFDAHGERVYTEMNTGTWWWDTQVCPLITFWSDLSYIS